MGEEIADRVYPGNRRGKVCASRIPAEQIVVTRRFSARRFDKRETGEQSPVECVEIGGFEEGCGIFGCRAIGAAEESAKSFKSGIVAIIRSRCGRLVRGKRNGQSHQADHEHTTGNYS